MEIRPIFQFWDYVIFVIFLLSLILIAYYSTRNVSSQDEDFYLHKRKLNLFFYVLTTVATWYGGILGAGEFSYRYGVSSWFTQGLPYYIFAILFAIFFAKKVRKANVYTISEIVEINYGKKVSLLVASILLIIVSPAPYILMIGSLISFILGLNLYLSIFIALFLSTLFLYKGGFKTNIWTDAFEFFIMFSGFIIIVVISYLTLGGYSYLESKLPSYHLTITGGLPFGYLLVWFLIALWTFVDPGFHQRASAAKTENVAFWGIIISVIFWLFFDFLTTTTGLYAKAFIPNIENPVLAYPIYAEKILSDGWKGVFYIAMFATILSTSNSFMFLSSTIINKDILDKTSLKRINTKKKALISLSIISLIVIIITYLIPSVIDMWYTIGTLFIPGVIFIVSSCYYPKIKMTSNYALLSIILSIVISLLWFILKNYYIDTIIEPMLVGLIVPIIIFFIFRFKSRIVN